MEYPKLFYKADIKRLETNSNLKGVFFTKPRLVAYYEKNGDVIESAKRIFYFKEPKFHNYPLDLNIGYMTYIKPSNYLHSNALEYTLNYVMEPKAQINIDNPDKIKVFARRGTFVEFMSWYNCKRFSTFTVRVSRYNGNLYMVHVNDNEIPRNLRLYEPKHTHHAQFLRNLFTESFEDEPNINEPIDENREPIGVHQSSFGIFEMIYQGGIHGIHAQNEIKNIADLKILNACRFVMAKQMWYFVRNDDSRIFKYFLEAYLANISDIYFAYKNKDGIVNRPVVHKLPSQLVKEFNWKVGIYAEFLYEFLQRVNDLLTNHNINSLNTVYEIYFNSESKTFSYEIFKENTEKVFITKEYMEYCKQL